MEDEMMNWLLWTVIALFVLCIVIGAIRGVFKITLSLVSTILSMVIVLVLSPYISDFISNHTPVREIIEKKMIEQFMPEIPVEELTKADLSDTPLKDLSTEEISNLNKVDWAMLGITPQDILHVMGEIPRDEQIRLIDRSRLPVFLKDRLQENNNPAIYEELHTKTFPEYVAAYLSRMGIRLISFLVTFIIAAILIKALFVAINVVGELPVVGFFNHLAGGVLGMAVALLLVWLSFLVVTVSYGTPAGRACFALIDESQLLTFLYKNNLLLTMLLRF